MTRVLSWSPLFYLAFSALDWIVYRHYFAPLLQIRALFAGVCLACLWRVLKSKTYKSVMVVTVIAFLAASLGIVAMCHLTDGVSSPYYVGLILCFLFAAALFSWPTRVSLGTFSLPLFLYFFPVLMEPAAADLGTVSLHAFFLASSLLIALIGMNTRNRLAFQGFLGQQALARRNRELADLHDLKDRMFQNVSHELRTPLTLMLTPLQKRLAEPSLSGDERNWTQEMYRNGLRLFKQISDLLDLARLDSNGVVARKEPVEIGLLLKSLVDDVGSSVDAAGLTIELELPAAPVFYSLDPSHLEQVLLNLLGNSVKFTPSGGAIHVAARTTSAGLEISVEDTGPGIPREQQERVFDRFHQIEGDTTRHEGSGIGLALVRELVQLMGGEVAVRNVGGRGSRFTVLFPLALAIDSSVPRGQAALSRGTASLHRRADLAMIGPRPFGEARIVAGRRGPRVLIVEDDDRLRHQLAQILAEEHRVIGVARGQEALREALLFRPQVVVSDVMMPGMDGVELCRRFRERAELKSTAVVLLTARSSLEDRIEGRRVGADSYLTKPFDVRELVATIEGLLRSRMHLVGEYLVHSRLGRGGQGDVWLAEHRASGDRVALKIVRPGGLEDERVRARLRREHEALARLEHPNIVRIVARGEQAGGLFLAMEYLEGVTLDELVRSGGELPFEATSAIFRGAAAALSFVHGSGLVHRDVKCSNVMLLNEQPTLESRVRLIDFGTAAAVRQERSRSRRIVGSLPYMAPELLMDAAAASPATDVYGLGIVMYRLVTGELPYEGSTVEEMIEKFERGPTTDLIRSVARVPGTFARVIEQAIARDPARRWSTAAELVDALKPFPDSTVEILLPEADSFGGRTATFQRTASQSTATTTH